jgi:LDH2 family malate/lactate/ureidoglycolate dehydrogenase
VSDQDFLFALDVSGDAASDPMLADLARTVLGHLGYAGSAIDALTGQLQGALAGRVSDGKRRFEVRFRSEAGQLEIVVSGAGPAAWRTSWPLPTS